MVKKWVNLDNGKVSYTSVITGVTPKGSTYEIETFRTIMGELVFYVSCSYSSPDEFSGFDGYFKKVRFCFQAIENFEQKLKN